MYDRLSLCCVWCKQKIDFGQTVCFTPGVGFHYGCWCEYQSTLNKLSKEAGIIGDLLTKNSQKEFSDLLNSSQSKAIEHATLSPEPGLPPRNAQKDEPSLDS